VWTLVDVVLIAIRYVGPADGSLYIWSSRKRDNILNFERTLQSLPQLNGARWAGLTGYVWTRPVFVQVEAAAGPGPKRS
jgi:hypothetical protein